jgi:hypothetical protein
VAITNGDFTLRSQHNHGIRASNDTTGGGTVLVGNITITGGRFNITVDDEPINAERTATVTGGQFAFHNLHPGGRDD